MRQPPHAADLPYIAHPTTIPTIFPTSQPTYDSGTATSTDVTMVCGRCTRQCAHANGTTA